MIAKIKSGKKFYGAALYNQQKVDAKKAKILYQSGFVNTNPKTIADTLHALNNSRTKQPVFHASLSFAKADSKQLTDEKMIELAKEYMDKLGYKNQPMIIYRHFDTEHPHLHILTTRVDVKSQTKINDHMEGRRSKAITDSMEIKHDLTVADQSKIIEKEIVKDLQSAIESSKPESLKFLNKALEKEGSPIRANAAGKGVIFYTIDEHGKRNSKAYKASLFKEHGLSHQTLQTQFKTHQADRNYVKTQLASTLNNGQKFSIRSFKNELQDKQIEAKFRVGSESYLGVNYQYKGHTYKASDLDRSLSWAKTKTQLDLPTKQDFKLKQALMGSLKTGQPIDMTYKNGQLNFSSSKDELTQQLNEMPQREAMQLVEKYHGYQSRNSTDWEEKPSLVQEQKNDYDKPNTVNHQLNKLLHSFSDEVDEYLNKRRKKSHGNERNLRIE